MSSCDPGTPWQTVPEEPERVNDFHVSSTAPDGKRPIAAAHLDGSHTFALSCPLVCAMPSRTDEFNLHETDNSSNRKPAYDTDNMARGA
jgi:hypothetical protein